MNRKKIGAILLILALLLGVVGAVAYDRYGEEIRSFFVNDQEDPQGEDLKLHSDALYIAPAIWGFGIGDSAEWSFYVLQVEVIEYRSEGGLNFVVGEYRPFDNEDYDLQRVKILLTREDEWENRFEGLDGNLFESVVTDTMEVRETYDIRTINSWNISFAGIDEIREEFPVGNRMPVAIPRYYPLESTSRTDELCAKHEQECSYSEVLDVVSAGLEAFNNGEDLFDDETFFLLPYSISPDIFSSEDLEELRGAE